MEEGIAVGVTTWDTATASLVQRGRNNVKGIEGKKDNLVKLHHTRRSFSETTLESQGHLQ
jgi:hypothetical protein